VKTSYLDLLGTIEITGSEIQSETDAIVTHLADGTPLGGLWTELKDVTRVWNENRNALVRLLSYPTTAAADLVPQSLNSESLEPATEFGVPKAVKADPAILMSYTLDDYDIATRFSWRFLRSATREQVAASVDRVLEADVKCLTGTVLNRIFDPSEALSPENQRVFGLWNGTDNLAPLRYMNTQFPANHTHYLVSGGATIDSEDLEVLIRNLQHHGYGRRQGSQILILCNEEQLEEVAKFRAGIQNNNSKVAKYDFIASASAPPYLTTSTLVGATPPGELNGLPVAGQYGPAWVLMHELIPPGYLLSAATGGVDSLANVLAFRQHPRPEYQGLRPIPGVGPYPIQESFFARAFGVGVRHRGASCAMQIKTGVNADYVKPEIPT